MGLYSVAPGSTSYQLGAPLFDEVSLSLEGGGQRDQVDGGSSRQLKIIAHRNGPERVYVERVTFNGEPVEGWEIEHRRLAAGGTLEFHMTDNSTESETAYP